MVVMVVSVSSTHARNTRTHSSHTHPTPRGDCGWQGRRRRERRRATTRHDTSQQPTHAEGPRGRRRFVCTSVPFIMLYMQCVSFMMLYMQCVSFRMLYMQCIYFMVLYICIYFIMQYICIYFMVLYICIFHGAATMYLSSCECCNKRSSSCCASCVVPSWSSWCVRREGLVARACSQSARISTPIARPIARQLERLNAAPSRLGFGKLVGQRTCIWYVCVCL